MITEYHEPAFVEAVTKAVVESAATGRTMAVWNDHATHTFRCDFLVRAPETGTRWIINGLCCEEQFERRKIRECVMTPVAFRCVWKDSQ